MPHSWQMIYGNGPADPAAAGRTSYESPYTALERAASAAISRAARASQSSVIVRNKITGLVIFAWYGENWIAGPVEEIREVPRDRYCLHPIAPDGDDVCLKPGDHSGEHSASGLPLCERPGGDGLPCGFPASHMIMLGARRADTENACELHLTKAIVAMLSAENRENALVTVGEIAA